MQFLLTLGDFFEVGANQTPTVSLIFLRREDATTKIAVFQFTHHILRSKASPTCAKYAIQ